MKRLTTSSLAVLAGIVVLGLALPVFAQTLATAATEAADADLVGSDSWLHSTWIVVQPIAAVFITASASAIAGLVVTILVKQLSKLGVEVAETDRMRLHEAATNALNAAVAKYVGPPPDMISGSVPKAIIDAAMEYMKNLNPGDAGKLTDAQLTDIILSKVPEVAAVVAASKPSSNTSGTVEVAKASSKAKG